jgi:probable F420-dependent oxidoreductase
MKFGMHLGIRDPAAEPDSLTEIVRAAEDMGFDYLGFSDHVVIADAVDSVYPYTADGKWFAEHSGECLEQISTICFAAAVTSRIRLLTSVMVLPHRPALLAAKMLTTADVLSNGRLTVGAGVGWMAEEIALLDGPDFAKRGKAADEMISGFKELWTAPRPQQSGDHISFDGVLFAPKPAQKPHPPIWIGGESAPARRRAGRIGDGWYPVCNNPKAPFDTPERYAAGLADVHAAAAAAGRDGNTLATGLYVIWHTLEDAVLNDVGERKCFTGSPGDIERDIAAFEAAGLQNLVIGFEAPTASEVIRRMSAFAAVAIKG